MNKIKYVQGDLFKLIKTYDSLATFNGKPDNHNIIVPHVCNDQGVMGAGFARQLVRHYPRVMDKYPALCKRKGMGYTDFTYYVSPAGNRFIFANMIAQDLGNGRRLKYNHLVKCMEDVAKLIEFNWYSSEIVAPKFGSELADGDWSIIEELINDTWLLRDIEVTIVEYAKL